MSYDVQSIKDAIHDIADPERQLSLWFNHDAFLSSPDEMCNRLDDVLFTEWINDPTQALPDYFRGFCLKFLGSIEALPERLDPWETYSSSDWGIVVKQAQAIEYMINHNIM